MAGSGVVDLRERERDEGTLYRYVSVRVRRYRDCDVGSELRRFIGTTELKRMRESRFHRTRFVLRLQYSIRVCQRQRLNPFQISLSLSLAHSIVIHNQFH